MGSKPQGTTRFTGIIDGINPNELPSGSLHMATLNVIMREVDTIEARIGLARLLKGLRYDKLIAYNQNLIGHTAANGAMTRFIPPDFITANPNFGTCLNPATRKIQSSAAGGRLFVTTGTGLQVLDDVSTGPFRDAGGPQGLSASFIDNPASGWLADGNSVAYRYTLGRLTAPVGSSTSGIQVIGAPSGRVIFSNSSGGIASVDGTFHIPDGLDTSCFIQLWRSSQVLSTIQPEDDLRLVFERTLTADEVVSGVVLINDVTPDELRGDYLYTSPNAGEGILMANQKPPMGEEIALFKDRLWQGRTTQPHEFSFNLLGVGAPNGLVANDVIVITGMTPQLVLVAGVDFAIFAGGSASQNVSDTAQSLVDSINSSSGGTGLLAEYTSGPDDVPGGIRLYRSTPTGAQFAVWVDQQQGGAAWTSRAAFAPEIFPLLNGRQVAPLTFTFNRFANVTTATVSSGNITNGVRVGDTIILNNGSVLFGQGPHVVTAVGANSFDYAEVGANAGPFVDIVSMYFSVAEPAVSTQETAINRIHWSKPDEFEAWPFHQFQDIGASDKGIIAMRVTRETLWIFKEDGLYRVTGDNEDTFDFERVDATIVAVANECVVNFAESVVAWTTKGIVMVSESIFEPISDDISRFLRLYLEYTAIPTADTYGRLNQAYMVADDREGLLRLHLPGSSQDGDGTLVGCGEALVYSIKNKAWTRCVWLSSAGFPKPLEFGVIEPTSHRAMYCDGYLGGAGEGFLWQERSPVDSAVNKDDDEENPVEKMSFIERVIFAYQHAKAPMRDKRFDEVSILFDKPTNGMPTAFRYGFGNENDEVGESEFLFGSPVATVFIDAEYQSETPENPNVRCMVSTDASRGQRLWVTIEHDSEDGPFRVLGFSVLCEVLNGNISR